MSEMNTSDLTPDELRREIERLQVELQETTQEKVQAAEYGLAVLEEKERLRLQIEEIEGHYETVKHELDCAKEVRVLLIYRFHYFSLGLCCTCVQLKKYCNLTGISPITLFICICWKAKSTK